MSGELFALTYGCTVNMLLQDGGGVAPGASPAPVARRCQEVNAQLFDMGRRIGERIVDDYLAHHPAKCTTLESSVDATRNAMKHFLSVSDMQVRKEPLSQDEPAVPKEGPGSQRKRATERFVLSFGTTPLQGFAELPSGEEARELRENLWYSNVLCGVIQTALSLVGKNVTVAFRRCMLRGDTENEIVIVPA